MKTAIHVLCVLQYVGCFLGALFMIMMGVVILATDGDPTAVILFLLAFCCIIPAIVPILTQRKLSKATSKSDLTIWGVLNLFLGSFIAGILLLAAPEESLVTVPPQNLYYNPYGAPYSPYSPPNPQNPPYNPPKTPYYPPYYPPAGSPYAPFPEGTPSASEKKEGVEESKSPIEDNQLPH